MTRKVKLTLAGGQKRGRYDRHAAPRLHTDRVFLSTELISAATFQEAVQEGTQNAVADDWRLEWVLRYSIIVKSRGIIKAKGYLVSARKASP